MLLAATIVSRQFSGTVPWCILQEHIEIIQALRRPVAGINPVLQFWDRIVHIETGTMVVVAAKYESMGES